MSKHFEEAMKSVMEDDPELLSQINKLAEAAGQSGRVYTVELMRRVFGDN